MEFVEVNSVEYPMKYGHISLKKYMYKYGLKKLIELDQLLGKITIEDMPGFVKAGFDTGAKILGDEPPFSQDQINDLLESHLWLEAAAMEAFAKSIERPVKPHSKSDNGEAQKEPEPAEIDAGN